MPQQPLRFLHAAAASLDCPPLWNGPLPDELRGEVEEATLTAWERMIDTAIAERVDFLLLCGETFIEAACSVRAEAALRNAFVRLAQHDIDVFVRPGESDPAWAWQAIEQQPENFVLCRPSSEAVVVRRNGEALAIISAVDIGRGDAGAAGPHPMADGGRHRPFDIRLGPSQVERGRETSHPREASRSHEPGFWTSVESNRADDAAAGARPETGLDCDYLALGGVGRRRTFQVSGRTVHHPGMLVGLTPDQTGPHGFSLVEIDASGAARCRLITAAPVRWEEVHLVVNDEGDRRRLAELMHERLSAVPIEPAERLCGITWHIAGCRALAEELASPGSEAALFGRLAGDRMGGVALSHRLLVDVSAQSLSADLGPLPDEELRAALTQLAALCEVSGDVLSSAVAGIDQRHVDIEARRLAATILPDDV